MVEGASTSQKPEVDTTFGGTESPVFTIKIYHANQTIMMGIKPGVKVYELMEYLEDAYPSQHTLSLVTPPNRNTGGLIWRDAQLLDSADEETRFVLLSFFFQSLGIFPFPAWIAFFFFFRLTRFVYLLPFLKSL